MPKYEWSRGMEHGGEEEECLQLLQILGFTRAIPTLQFLCCMLSNVLDEVILLATALQEKNETKLMICVFFFSTQE